MRFKDLKKRDSKSNYYKVSVKTDDGLWEGVIDARKPVHAFQKGILAAIKLIISGNLIF